MFDKIKSGLITVLALLIGGIYLLYIFGAGQSNYAPVDDGPGYCDEAIAIYMKEHSLQFESADYEPDEKEYLATAVGDDSLYVFDEDCVFLERE